MFIRWIVVFSLGFAACQVNTQDAPTLKTQKDKVSYSIGRNIGENLKKQPIDINQDALSAGIKDALSEGESLLTDEEVREVLNEFQQGIKNKAEARIQELGEKNKKEGEAFLAANKKKDGTNS
ncbi:MAG: FKBP-type peptidyl-prolyl cis-trans isomerase N-terminal domain-containing protein [Bacteroidetes bacterium]|nr:FKBP-type peptidyl-prolyl cis-trans isomerase N-terminal domain-containing protein [Bacteroidota bacterium]